MRTVKAHRRETVPRREPVVVPTTAPTPSPRPAPRPAPQPVKPAPREPAKTPG
jgi:hypothetical protein